ncbi:TonB-dependent siderophore receptor [Novosphingobium sp. P6W]|uniref:TonB-dependent receptor plug domain-containing protein n=1 Tax=Novosphingobium sp. P6W TaxID=1609758 RepID=UPI0005C2DAA3|nr:TonB-dependent receptor [Novosphingobium sp. P6W]AXB77021.1 TonB-dependent receptor [Novosphingobium sp. P6W]KIS33139.1 TonB-dependent receptor [Novosphingobium sp. P6W]
MKYRVTAALAASLASAISAPALAADADDGGNTFGLGQIVVTAPRSEESGISSTSVNAEAIYDFSRDTLDEAVKLIPGVTSGISGNSRNERLIFVRGFDRFQVPLSIDGIRVYLPADGRLDYGRFLTPDVAEIQVAKGYVSVLNGPGAMGGAVNLVTRKPQKEYDAEARFSLNLDNDTDYAGYTGFASLGTKHDMWYAQASYARNFTDHWNLSKDFKPTRNEDGGARDLSRTEDWRVNAKIGFTPNATDEYAISYTRQEGEKLAPTHVSDSTGLRYWTWPYWNLQNVYFLSTTQLGEIATLRTRAYYNTFKNSLDSFDDKTLTTQTRGSSFNSAYSDRAYGGSAQLDLRPSDAERLSVSFHYRNDRHREIQQSFPSGVFEPWQTTIEETYSAAIENGYKLTPQLELVVGASYDWRDLRRAEDYTSGAFVYYNLRNGDAWNAQGQLLWTPDDATNLHLAVSSRARFPTIFERFSTRFGGATSNPDINAERATQIELGGARQFGPLRIEASGWYAKIDDAIVSFPFIFQGQATAQSRNVGSGDYYGAEFSATAQIAEGLRAGANYGWVHRKLDDPSLPAFHATGVPEHSGFVWAEWSPIKALRILPSLDVASKRWTVNTAGTRYYKIGSYALANLRVDFDVTDWATLGVGGRNLFDENYATVDGYPEGGRTLFVSLRLKN